MAKFYDAVYSIERVRGYQFVKLYISMFEKWLESPQWLLAVSKPEVRMRVTSAWGQEWTKTDRGRLADTVRDMINNVESKLRSISVCSSGPVEVKLPVLDVVSPGFSPFLRHGICYEVCNKSIFNDDVSQCHREDHSHWRRLDGCRHCSSK